MNRVVRKLPSRFSFVYHWRLENSRHLGSKAWSSKTVRQSFTEFFRQRDHLFVPSSSVIAKKNDGSYFVNAGMNQFKPLFLGTVDPQSTMATYRRVANTQKCIRVGGKHNDLDDVGYDTYHHTFFEMLGSWSFADYFKKEACSMAWTLLTEVYGLPMSQLYVTYFGGCTELGLEPDIECKEIWQNIGVSPDHILPFGMKDNFWAMGNTGPCGPCTEIHFDRVIRSNASHLVNANDPQVIELWNLVFMQFDRQLDGSLRKLPQKHVDTGMGLERLTAVLQGHASNYDTDLFTPLFHAIVKSCHCPAYTGSVGKEGERSLLDTAYRIVADHTRMLTVTIGDGMLPGRRESEAKLRHIMHRCIHQATQVLGSSPGFVGDLTSVVVDLLGDVYPELTKNRDQIKDVTNRTAEQYLENLEVGRKVLAKALSKYGNIKTLSGAQLLEIQDGRFGKSVSADVISILAKEIGIVTQMEEFDELLQLQQEPPSMSSASSGELPKRLDMYDLEHLKRQKVCPTDDSFKYCYTCTPDGYEFKPVKAKVVALKYNGQFVDHVDQSKECGVLFDKTNFYAEAGGQVADSGAATTEKGNKMLITDVQSCQNFVLHTAFVETESLSIGDTVQLEIDKPKRVASMCNHTATHVLNFCLNQVLGKIRQQSSMVSDTRLTFEFTCLKSAMSNDDSVLVSEMANDLIQKGSAVFRSTIPLDTAKNIEHLVMLKDEVYPASVNVISVGVPVSDLLSKQGGSGNHNSVELCCGTHVDNIGHIHRIVITHLQGSNQATKRLIAVTGQAAVEAIENAKTLKLQLENLRRTKSGSDEAIEIVESINQSLSDGRLLPKVDREYMQKELEQVLHVQQVNRMKNEGKLTSLAKAVSDILVMEESSTAIVAQLNFSKTREVVEVLARLAPNRPMVLVSNSDEGKNTIVGVTYIPKEGLSTNSSLHLAANLCHTFGGLHSLPKGKLSKHSNIQVFSIPLQGNRIHDTQRVLDVARTFIDSTKAQYSDKSVAEVLNRTE